MTLRIAVLAKQVPKFDEMRLGPDGRLERSGLPLEMNPYCRRAVAKGVELAREAGGSCTVLTLGPPSAEDVLKEAIAWGADEGLLISDLAFAGSDTLATAQALAAAIRVAERDSGAPFDLIIAGLNSVDADTGQVGPQLAELLDLPLLSGVRELRVRERRIRARCETDNGHLTARLDLPALITAAERLCDPCKVPPEHRAGPDRIRVLRAAELGPGPWGPQASPTEVGEVRVLRTRRSRAMPEGPIEDQIRTACAMLAEAFARTVPPGGTAPAPVSADRVIGILAEPGRGGLTRELLGGAARLGGRVVALTAGERADGADEVVELDPAPTAEDFAAGVTDWAKEAGAWAVLAPSTSWGREVAGRLAVRLDAGLAGDVIDLQVRDGRLVCWKPAFGGHLVAEITMRSAVQIATVRPGVLTPSAHSAREGSAPTRVLRLRPRRRVEVTESVSDDDPSGLAQARAVIGVGQGVDPARYAELGPLVSALGAELAATRKVTDRGWLPRSRQLGITGRVISPELYVVLGSSGKFNHMVGVRGAGFVIAVNSDPSAPVFDAADVGIVGDWRAVVPVLARELAGVWRAG
ncbi:FAD-binding protein [Rhizohabitans arisaemae]|uniref:FAD-binding protein n=1 Tax=Rhizohabitans arisaemae TaxID=2720610 RepID=UPI0024B21B4C|nr:FAD-binding protein [Rhizohabitans arisaemae]